jgi:hypothetical protein
MIGRRAFLSYISMAVAGLATLKTKAVAEDIQGSPRSSTRLPDPKLFQAGDLIWPRKPGEVVPYAASHFESEAAAAAAWRADRDAYIANIRANWNSSSLGKRDSVALLDSMTYPEFKRIYFQAASRDQMVPYGSSSGFYTGHVAMLTQTTLDPIVVEAIWGKIKKVRTIRYSEWLRERPNELVWHGRLRSRQPEERRSVAELALTYVDRPYNFWNFDLSDDSSFYCSKLVWLCAWKTLQISVDGKPNPDRSIWFSPKQLMKSEAVFLLNDPENYGG